jgi:tetratricopeptide (TPR) repeat protein
MTRLRRRWLRALAPPAIVLVVGLAVFDALSAGTEPARSRAFDAAGLTKQGNDELQKARETADPAHYARADALFRSVLAHDARDVDATIGRGTLALARHDFRDALRIGQVAHRLAPELARPYAVLVDAQVELGRYAAARGSLQRMIDLRPNLASYARVSYFRELHGDLRGALQAMALAVSAGGQVPENVAYVQTLLGDLQATRGQHAAARRAYRTALAENPGYVPARVSLARLDGAEGNVRRAIRGYRRVVIQRPLPEYVVALGEAQQAAGRSASARETFALVDAERRLLAANGINTDVEIALFEADHGDRRRAIALGRRAWRAAPSVRSADAVGWALTRGGHPAQGLAWEQRALRLGWRDPIVLTRAGISARAAGRPAVARRYLRRALRATPHFSLIWAPRARHALKGL